MLVEPEQRLDPTCAEMARSPLPSAGLPGPSVLGFVCCGAVVRRAAYLAVGGFEPRFRIGGEEALLALDLAAAGWDLCYAADVVAHHEPFPGRSDRGDRHRLTARNALWCAWLRYRPRLALAHTMRTAAAAIADRDVRAGLTAALAGLPWVWKERRPVPAHLDRALRACRSLPAG